MTADLFGFIRFSEYVKIPRVNFSTLKHFARSPLMYKYRLDHPQKQTDDMRMGNVAHKMILEPDQFSAEYSIWFGAETKSGSFSMSKNTTAYKERVKLEAEAGRIVIDGAMFNKAVEMRIAATNHAIANSYLEGAIVARTVLWDCKGVQCKSRLDIVQSGKFICDLKTSRDPFPGKFKWTARDLHYDAQLAFYRSAWYAETGELLPVKILAIEKEPPFEIVCYTVPEYALAAGEELYLGWIEELKQCQDSGKWPGRYENEVELEVPERYNSEAETSLIIGGEEVTL